MKNYQKHNIMKRCTILTLIAALIIMLFPQQPVQAATKRTSYDIGKQDVVIKKNGSYNLTGKSNLHKITVNKGVKATIYMTNVNMSKEYCAESLFTIEEKACVTLVVKGSNTIKNTAWSNQNDEIKDDLDAIRLKSGAKLLISKYSTGTLNVSADSTGSGIGGNGSLTISGGTVNAYGGTFGAGLGNTMNPKAFTVTINGGTVNAYGGIGNTEWDSYSQSEFKNTFKNTKVYDIAANKCQIDGGMLMASDFYKDPVNKAGKEVYQQLFNCKTGKIKKITADKTDYGCTGMESKGYLNLWLASEEKFTIEYTNGTKQNIDRYGSTNVEEVKEPEFDIQKSSLLILNSYCIFNNHVYQLPMESHNKITVTGTTGTNHIMVKADTNLILNSVEVTGRTTGVPFLTAGRGVDVTLIAKGKNSFNSASNDRMMVVGHEGSLSVTGDSDKDVLKFTLNDNADGIIVNYGDFALYGGKIEVNANKAADGIFVGYGCCTIYDGICEGNTENGKLISGAPSMTIKVCGGQLTADNIGYMDVSNEMIGDYSKFIQTGGTVNVKNRMIFRNFMIYGGKLEGHLLGAGSGSTYSQFGGSVKMDRFITDYSLYEEFDNGMLHFDSETGKVTGTAIDQSNIYGGTLEETKNITKEDLAQICFGQC